MPERIRSIHEIGQEANDQLVQWYESNRGMNGSEPDRYVMAAGLYVTEVLKRHFPIERELIDTGKGQVRGAGKARIQKILKQYGEERVFASEGGRTTRGTLPAAHKLADRLNSVSEIGDLEDLERERMAGELQSWVVSRVIDFFNRERIKIEIDRTAPLESIVEAIIDDSARSASYKSGPTAQHLVGAKLAMRFSDAGIEVPNYPANAADFQTGRLGDFEIRDTVFHVTLAPGPDVVNKCKLNLSQGKRVVLLVPKGRIEAARQLADIAGILERISVNQSISGFVGQNIEELGEYSQLGIERQLKRLLELYNSRVESAEADQSIQIEIPQWLMELNP